MTRGLENRPHVFYCHKCPRFCVLICETISFEDAQHCVFRSDYQTEWIEKK
jgi:hypothetical protein